MNNYSTEQLQKIVDDAPEGADYIKTGSIQEDIYLRFQTGRLEFFGKLSKRWRDTSYQSLETAYGKGLRKVIKLSEIRAELLACQFKVGDLVVFTDISCFPSDLLSVTQMTEFEIYLSNGMSFRHDLEWLRHATPEEIVAGHRIDKAKNHFQSALSEAKAHIDSLPEWQRQGLSDAMNASHRIDEPASSCGMTALEIDQFGKDLRNKPYVDLPEFEQPDIITTQLDPAKCRVVDPAVYDAPTDSPRDDFDAMSESHRSPACKCHEFPFYAELIPDAVNHPSHYTSDPSGIECIEITRHRNFNVGNAIKYLWRAGRKEQAATVQDLQKAIWYINDEIARLEGE